MGILKEGKLPAKELHRGTCYTCHAEVEFERGEGKVTCHTLQDESSVIVKCPTVGCPGSIISPITYRSIR